MGQNKTEQMKLHFYVHFLVPEMTSIVLVLQQEELFLMISAQGFLR